MKHPFFLSLTLGLTSLILGCAGPRTLTLDFTYLPERTYTTRMESSVVMVMGITGDEKIREQITQGEMVLPVTSEIQTRQVFKVKTEKRGSNGRIHYSGELVKSERTMKINGVPQPEGISGEPDAEGFKYTGFVRKDGSLDLEGIKIEGAHPQAGQIMETVIQEIKKQFEFPQNTLKAGDVFSKEMEFKFPRVPPVKIKTAYQLARIERRRGIFNIIQTFNWSGKGEEGVEIEMRGKGSGSGIYDRKNRMWESLEFNLDLYFLIDMTIARIETNGTTRSTMTVTILND